MIERESNIEDCRDDCDMYDDEEDIDSILPRELDVSELNIKLVGVNTSVWEDTEGGKAGTGVNGCNGDCGGAEVIGEIDAGMVLIRLGVLTDVRSLLLSKGEGVGDKDAEGEEGEGDGDGGEGDKDGGKGGNGGNGGDEGARDGGEGARNGGEGARDDGEGARDCGERARDGGEGVRAGGEGS